MGRPLNNEPNQTKPPFKNNTKNNNNDPPAPKNPIKHKQTNTKTKQQNTTPFKVFIIITVNIAVITIMMMMIIVSIFMIVIQKLSYISYCVSIRYIGTLYQSRPRRSREQDMNHTATELTCQTAMQPWSTDDCGRHGRKSARSAAESVYACRRSHQTRSHGVGEMVMAKSAFYCFSGQPVL